MLFMVIERFRDNDMIPVYQHLRDQGRVLPEGLEGTLIAGLNPTLRVAFN